MTNKVQRILIIQDLTVRNSQMGKAVTLRLAKQNGQTIEALPDERGRNR